MQKVLFIDRDGTLVLEPPDTQLDACDKLVFYPEMLRYLGRIVRECDYLLVMITNQDGLGTEDFPEDTFWPTHKLLLRTLAGEGIDFADVLIDRSFPEEGALTRKPHTGLLTTYLKGDFNIAESFVIGDRLTDMELAQNLGCRGILIGHEGLGDEEVATTEAALPIALRTDAWRDIYRFLRKH